MEPRLKKTPVTPKLCILAKKNTGVKSLKIAFPVGIG